MPEQKIAQFGSWKSPLTAELIVSESVGLNQPAILGNETYSIEMRPSEGGRNAIVRHSPEAGAHDVIGAPFNSRTRVHEYGGGDYLVHDGSVYFANFVDQRLYVTAGTAAPRPLTPEGRWRYSDAIFDNRRRRLISIREDHQVSDQPPINTIVSLALDSVDPDPGVVLTAGNDFYAAPRLAPDGSRLAWLTWNHPDMPWDGCELWLADVDADGGLRDARLVAGGTAESIFQPAWSPDGQLYFVSDRSGWWNICRVNKSGSVEAVYALEAEFGMPQWVFGMSSFAFASSR